MSEKSDQQGPDHTLLGAKIEETGEEPEVYAVSDLRAFVTPDLDEELGRPTGVPTQPGVEVTCSCVPVETCVVETGAPSSDAPITRLLDRVFASAPWPWLSWVIR